MSIFSDLANTKLGEVEPPKNVPTGHYQAIFTGMWKEHKAKSGNTAARFPMKLVAPGDDVDAEELSAAGGIPDKNYTFDFWMSPDALYRFTDFAKAMGHSDQLGLVEALEAVATSGDPFLIEVTHQPDQNNPEKVYMRFDNPTPIA